MEVLYAKEKRYTQNSYFGPVLLSSDRPVNLDYSGTQACKALKSLGYEIVLV